MSRPGGFTGVLAGGSWNRSRTNFISVEACLSLPPAVPVHATHEPLRAPVGIASPWFCPEYFDDGGDAIVVDAIFGSYARKAFARVQAGDVYLSPWWREMDWRQREGRHYATSATITSADLVASPRDKRARITSVTPFER